MENDTTTQNTPTVPVRSETGMGATIGILVIILVLATGGVYLWMSKKAPAPTANQSETAQNEAADPMTQALLETSASDSASAIEADLNATDTGDASSDLQVQ